MKKMIIAAAAFLAMIGIATAGSLSSTDELMGSAATSSTQLSNAEMAGVSGGSTAVDITTIIVRQTATAANTVSGAINEGSQPIAAASNSAVVTAVSSASVR